MHSVTPHAQVIPLWTCRHTQAAEEGNISLLVNVHPNSQGIVFVELYSLSVDQYLIIFSHISIILQHINSLYTRYREYATSMLK